MCRNCHKIYDYGDIGINPVGELKQNLIISELNLNLDISNKNYFRSQQYFDFHYKNISKNIRLFN